MAAQTEGKEYKLVLVGKKAADYFQVLRTTTGSILFLND